MIQKVKLGDVVEVSAGQPAPKSDEFSDVGTPFIRAGSLEALLKGQTEDDCEKIDDLVARKRRMKLYPKDTILFAKSGMSAKLGRIYRLKKASFVVSHLAALQPRGNYDPSYLMYWLRKNPPSSLIKDDAYPSIRTSEISALDVPSISLREQRRIAAILDKADAVRRKRAESLALADQFLKSVFLEMFGDPVTNTKGLPKEPIGSFGRVITGNTPPRAAPENYGDDIEWIKSDNINTPFHFLTEAEERLSLVGRRLGRIVPSGSTLVTCIAGSPSVIGNAALSNREVAFNQQINAVVPNSETNPFFLYCQFLVAKRLIQRSSTNSMKGMVSKGKFERIEFLKPSLGAQSEFGKVFLRFFEYLSRIDTDGVQSHHLFNSISQRAFRGEL